jgi:acetyl esterase/lipase
MTTRNLLDPELATAVDQLPVMPLNRENLVARRAARAQMMEMLLLRLPEIPEIGVTEQHVPATAHGPAVRVLVYRHVEATSSLPALLWIHGGGYVDGRADWDSHLAKTMAREAACCVVSVDYRLAPETPFPGAIDDCYAALKWLHAHAAEWRVDPQRIGVAGISAGGGLAAALALMARDRGELTVSFQALLQPMLDDRTAVDSYSHPFAGEFIWTREQNHFGWLALLGHPPGTDDVSPYAAAARAESLRGLPPTFISVGALDLFVEESVEYARRLIRDGIPTELHVHPGACHAFQFLAPHTAQAKLHDANFIAALRRAMSLAAG